MAMKKGHKIALGTGGTVTVGGVIALIVWILVELGVPITIGASPADGTLATRVQTVEIEQVHIKDRQEMEIMPAITKMDDRLDDMRNEQTRMRSTVETGFGSMTKQLDRIEKRMDSR